MTLDNFPNQRPTITLDFQKSKSLDPRISFERASTGTFTDKNDNIKTAKSGSPRFDWVNGKCQGMLRSLRYYPTRVSDTVLEALTK